MKPCTPILSWRIDPWNAWLIIQPATTKRSPRVLATYKGPTKGCQKEAKPLRWCGNIKDWPGWRIMGSNPGTDKRIFSIKYMLNMSTFSILVVNKTIAHVWYVKMNCNHSLVKDEISAQQRKDPPGRCHTLKKYWYRLFNLQYAIVQFTNMGKM